MKKKAFYLFAVFVGIFMMVAWHFAAAELATLQLESEIQVHTSDNKLADIFL